MEAATATQPVALSPTYGRLDPIVDGLPTPLHFRLCQTCAAVVPADLMVKHRRYHRSHGDA